MGENAAGLVLIAQGVYFVLTGVWPIVSIRTFESVTGPKIDRWLVQTLGALITAVGAAILVAGVRGSMTPESLTLAIGSALALAAADCVFVAKGRIAKIYLLDALVEVLLVAALLATV